MDENKPVAQKQLSAALDSLKVEILEAIHETETKLLGAFLQYQEVENIKFQKLSSDLSNLNVSLDQRLNNLEQRIVQIEKRIMMP
jgi:molybdopterin-guanine dinucleotide biosynthesis protein A